MEIIAYVKSYGSKAITFSGVTDESDETLARAAYAHAGETFGTLGEVGGFGSTFGYRVNRQFVDGVVVVNIFTD